MTGRQLRVFTLLIMVSRYVLADWQEELRNGPHDMVLQEDVLDAFKEDLESQPSSTTSPKDYFPGCFSHGHRWNSLMQKI